MNATPQNKVRIVTAASLFDGHDAAINIMRRILQSKGAEIIHLGHNRSVSEIVECAIEEDAHGIAITSYQGGHVEFFKYMKDLLDENGYEHIKIFGGGGGTFLPDEIRELHSYGITRIYSPDDGRHMGLEGMIEEVIRYCNPLPGFPGGHAERTESRIIGHSTTYKSLNGNGSYVLGEWKDVRTIAKAITLAENGQPFRHLLNGKAQEEDLAIAGMANVYTKKHPKEDPLIVRVGDTVDNLDRVPVLGITGTGGSGKSSVTDEILRRYLNSYPGKTIAIISVDPSKKKSGGALLGDRIRMNSVHHPRVYMRSLATRESDKALSSHVHEAIEICKATGFDFIILESAGVGQSDASILDYCDISLYVMTPEYGAASQLEKINMLDYADIVAINKFDKAGALDALHDVRKQYKRNHTLWTAEDETLPVFGTIASNFNDAGINRLFNKLVQTIKEKSGVDLGQGADSVPLPKGQEATSLIIPPSRIRYLSEISQSNRSYDAWAKEQCAIASKLYQLNGAIELCAEGSTELKWELQLIRSQLEEKLHPECKQMIGHWSETVKKYNSDIFEYEVRGKVIKQTLTTKTLSGTRVPKVVLPKYKDWGDILFWQLQENIPGEFPYTAGVFELKREGEDPTRMFAGEGVPKGPINASIMFRLASQRSVYRLHSIV